MVCGVTTLDYDHTSILGQSLTEIAWHKAGIFKPGSVAITADWSSETLGVLQSRSKERQVRFSHSFPYQHFVGVTRDHPEIISGNRYLHRLAGNIRIDFEIHPDIFLVTATQTIRLLIPDIISG